MSNRTRPDDPREAFEARRMGLSVEQYLAKLAEVMAPDSPTTTDANEMFNDWRDSDSEHPYWMWVARGRK